MGGDLHGHLVHRAEHLRPHLAQPEPSQKTSEPLLRGAHSLGDQRLDCGDGLRLNLPDQGVQEASDGGEVRPGDVRLSRDKLGTQVGQQVEHAGLGGVQWFSQPGQLAREVIKPQRGRGRRDLPQVEAELRDRRQPGLLEGRQGALQRRRVAPGGGGGDRGDRLLQPGRPRVGQRHRRAPRPQLVHPLAQSAQRGDREGQGRLQNELREYVGVGRCTGLHLGDDSGELREVAQGAGGLHPDAPGQTSEQVRNLGAQRGRQAGHVTTKRRHHRREQLGGFRGGAQQVGCGDVGAQFVGDLLDEPAQRG